MQAFQLVFQLLDVRVDLFQFTDSLVVDALQFGNLSPMNDNKYRHNLLKTFLFGA